MKKSKFIVSIAALMAVVIWFSGCSGAVTAVNAPNDTITEKQLPIEAEAVEFVHLLGMGAWATNLTLSQDGSFYGHYQDTNMGEIGDGHPNGTEYTCDFSGRFRDVQQINDYTYRMLLDSMEADETGKQWIEDGVLYITAEPVGMDGGKTFFLYTPGAPLDQLPEDLIFWWHLRYVDEESANKLGVFALYNEESGCGFFPVP